MIVKTLAAPAKYYQGPEILKDLYTYIKHLGKKFAVMTDEIVLGITEKNLQQSFKGIEADYEVILFGGQSTQAEADRIIGLVREMGAVAVGNTAALKTVLEGIPGMEPVINGTFPSAGRTA